MGRLANALFLKQTAHQLHAGAVIAYPTEAVWGLGCDPWQEASVSRIWDIKGRDPKKGLIVIGGTWAHLAPFLGTLTPMQQAQLALTWPGPVTWVVPCGPDMPAWLRGQHDSLALRLTRHAGARALCDAFGGALVSTSANRAGRPPARTALQVRRWFGTEVDVIVPGPTDGLRQPSEIRDLRTGAILRPARQSPQEVPRVTQ